MTELKPCPFCGGEVRTYLENVDAHTETLHFVCQECDMDAYFDFCCTESEAIDAWNRRATDER